MKRSSKISALVLTANIVLPTLTSAFVTPRSGTSLATATLNSRPSFSSFTRPSQAQQQPSCRDQTTSLHMAGLTSEAANQNIFGILSDSITGAAFSLLHAFDDCGIEDSSKNLRVLWVRALLNQRSMINDDVAKDLLPETTRGLVTSNFGSSLFDPIIQFTEWIESRTEFIDTGLDRFLSSPVCTDMETGDALECNVVLFGAGYDTRALRYRHRHDHKAHFIEVDLPQVVNGKQKLYEKYQREHDPTWNMDRDGSTLVPFDLNQCGGVNPKSIVKELRDKGGLKKNVPTLFVWEAVLFYVDEDAVRNIMRELFDFAQPGGNGDSERAETLLCFTDSLKPFVDVPFTNEALRFFSDNNLDLVEHRARWGGAVHFALASTRGGSGSVVVDKGTAANDESAPVLASAAAAASSEEAASEEASSSTTVFAAAAASSEEEASSTTVLETKVAEAKSKTTNNKKKKQDRITGHIGKYISDKVGGLVLSYTPTQANNLDLLQTPTFDNAWYAVAYPWQIDGYNDPVEAALNNHKENKRKKKVGKDGGTKPFATRLWGEPIVIYRDSNGKLVGMADVCPHRSAPLSMGTVNENDELVCFYHGWSFGKNGECSSVPTLQTIDATNDNNDGTEINDESKRDAKFKKRVTEMNCHNYRAVTEHEGLVWVWRGETLEADPSLLPTKRKGDMETVPIDSVLDYSVDYSYIVENNLDSPHLFYLHDGSVPPIESLGLMNKNLGKLKLTSFTDDCGMGHLGRLGSGGRPKKLLRFDPPNIVRHGGVSGFEEEFHIIPIAPHRTRVLLRQHLPRGPILSTITSVPYMVPFLTALVNSWNYHIALEDAGVMQGQASRIEDWGAPRMAVGGLGDDLIKRYWKWRGKAHKALNNSNKGEAEQQHDMDMDVTTSSPYFTQFATKGTRHGIPTGTAYGDSPEIMSKIRTESRIQNVPIVTDDANIDPNTGIEIGTWGIKQNYVQSTPAAEYPPMNYKAYKNLLVMDDLVKKILVGREPSSTMIKTAMDDLGSSSSTSTSSNAKEEQDETKSSNNVGALAGAVAAAAVVGMVGGPINDRVALAISPFVVQSDSVLQSMYHDVANSLQLVFNLIKL